MRATGAEVKFFHRGGTFVDKIADAGLEPVPLRPFITEAQNETLMAMDQHRAALGTPLPYTDAELTAMVESELAAYREFQPNGVYCGLNLSCMISVPHARIASISLVPTALCPAFFRERLASFPDAMDTPVLRHLVPRWAKRQLINRIMLGDLAKKSAVVFNQVRARYCLPPIYNFPSLVRGELTLLPDLPELSGLDASHLPAGYAYSGPLFARLSLPVPEEARRVFNHAGLKIYCSMGSSASAELLTAVVNILRSIPDVNLVCATTSLLDPSELGRPTERFFATRFLPAHYVNELADIAVIHGGQGTVQTAVWAGTPVVGVGMQWEQQANLDGLARAGVGMRLPLYEVNKSRILSAIDAVNTDACRSRMLTLKNKVRACNGAQEAVRQMNEFVRSRNKTSGLMGGNRASRGETSGAPGESRINK
jgi:UDP:flavonoid glycosyltransferase YjiC (YdhE family)